MKKVFDNIYMMKVNLPNNPLREVNSYLIKSETEGWLIIDTGFNTDECENEFFGKLNSFGIDIKDTKLLITHMHTDHSGLAYKYQKRGGGSIYCSRLCEMYLNQKFESTSYERVEYFHTLFGLPRVEDIRKTHPSLAMTEVGAKYNILEIGDIFKFGEFEFEIIDASGHTPDQINLYDRNHKIYFSADHVLSSISPNITYWGEDFANPLKVYIENLEKVKTYSIDVIFTGHRDIIYDYKNRIDELISHHYERLEECYEILQKSDSPMNALEVASQMGWRYRAKSFDDFPMSQKWFASGEAVAHLMYLYYSNRIEYKIIEDIMYFNINKI